MSLYDDGIDHTVCEAATTTTITNTTATPATPIEPSDSLAESSSLVVDFQPGFSSFQAAPEIEYHRERIENGGATLTPPIMSSSSSSSSSEQGKLILLSRCCRWGDWYQELGGLQHVKNSNHHLVVSSSSQFLFFFDVV